MKLKQTSLFNKINDCRLSLKEYKLLYHLYIKSVETKEHKIYVLVNFKNRIYINSDAEITKEGRKLVEEIDNMFKGSNKNKTISTLGPKAEPLLRAYINIFPTGKLPTGKPARSNIRDIEKNFIWFFKEYPQYTWKVIINATSIYVKEYAAKNFEMMRTSQYFIRKDIKGVVNSDLATYCDIYISGDYDDSSDNIPNSNIV